MITGLIIDADAKKKKKKAEKEIRAQKEADGKELQKGIDAKIRAEKDLANEYEGQAVIDPELQYSRNQSERATASAIDKATRSGASGTEVMNMVSGITARGQMSGQRISAEGNARRRQARAQSKGAAIQAANSGLAGKQAQIDLRDQTYNMVMQKQQQINQTAAQQNDYYTGIIRDVGGGVMMNDQNNKQSAMDQQYMNYLMGK